MPQYPRRKSKEYPTKTQNDYFASIISSKAAQTSNSTIANEKYLDIPLTSYPDLLTRGLPIAAKITTPIQDLDKNFIPPRLIETIVTSPDISYAVPDTLLFASEIFKKLLFRGYPTRLSPLLEKTTLQSVYGENVIKFDDNLEYSLSLSPEGGTHQRIFRKFPTIPSSMHCNIDKLFGSDAERCFYYAVLPAVIGRKYRRYTFLQVPIQSLDHNDTSQERLDFLLCFPGDNGLLAIEIDGIHHHEKKQMEIDFRRDNQLLKLGIPTLRIKLWEHSTSESQIHYLRKSLSHFKIISYSEVSLLHYLATDCITLQCMIVDLICSGSVNLNQKHLHIGMMSQLPSPVIRNAVVETLQGINHLIALYGLPRLSLPKVTLTEIGDLEKIPQNLQALVVVCSNIPAIDLDPGLLYQVIRKPIIVSLAEFHSFKFRYPLTNVKRIKAEPPIDAEKHALFFLRWLFWKVEFRPLQVDAILRAINGQDSIVLLPTGSGKSIVYQLSALLSQGTCISIAPLVSLVNDQVRVLKENHYIDRVFGFVRGQSTSERTEALNRLSSSEIYFAFLTPERFQTEGFLDALIAAHNTYRVNTVVIDEAHVVSEWGHDFRPAYLRIGKILKNKFSDSRPVFLALTATAARNVLRDIQRQLLISDPNAIISPKNFDRKNLHFKIYKSALDVVAVKLSQILTELPNELGFNPTKFWKLNGKDTQAGLVFVLTVDGYRGILKVHDYISEIILNKRAGCTFATGIYCGEKPKLLQINRDWEQVKAICADQFIHNDVHTLVATNAFGMGIDKPNIRFTINLGLPNSIEAFYQQAGRAGRDNKKSMCYLVFECDDNLVKNLEKDDWYIGNHGYSDLATQAFFLKSSFPGIENELREVQLLITHLDNHFGDGVIVIQNERPNHSRQTNYPNSIVVPNKKALYCIASLEKLGIINIVSARYEGNGDLIISIQVVPSLDKPTIATHLYESEYLYDPLYADMLAQRVRDLPEPFQIRDVYRVWLQSKYETILRGRIRSLRELAYLARDEVSDSKLRLRIENYLSDSIYSAELDQLITNGVTDLDAFVKLGESASFSEWQELGAQAGRLLEASPNNPGLLTLRALSLVAKGEKHFDSAIREFERAEDIYQKQTGMKKEQVKQKVRSFVIKIRLIEAIIFLVDSHSGFSLKESESLLGKMKPIKGVTALDIGYKILDARFIQTVFEIGKELNKTIIKEPIL